MEESVAARRECGWAAPAATRLSPARMRMEQGRRRTGCCSWVLNGKPLSLMDCFQVTQPLGWESCHGCRHQPLLGCPVSGQTGTKGFSDPCVLWAEE